MGASSMIGLKAKTIRHAAHIGSQLNHYFTSPANSSDISTVYIDATLGRDGVKDAIKLDIHRPKFPYGHQQDEVKDEHKDEEHKDEDFHDEEHNDEELHEDEQGAGVGADAPSPHKSVEAGEVDVENKMRQPLRPGLIIFHGGGFVLGSGSDDARWADTAVTQLGAVAITVSYRLSPEYPFPTAVEDCADAILHISQHAPEYGIDRDQLLLSGFSAGGNLAFAAFNLLQSPSTWGYHIPRSYLQPHPDHHSRASRLEESRPGGVESQPQPQPQPQSQVQVPRIRGIMVFYPLLDYTIPRETKRQSCIKPELTLAPCLTELFDQSYLPSSVLAQYDLHLNDPRISPGLAPDELIDKLPPVHLTLCEYDMLHQEGLVFAERLKGRNKHVEVRTVEGAKHAWDKSGTVSVKANIATEYGAVLEAAQRWLGRDVEEDKPAI